MLATSLEDGTAGPLAHEANAASTMPPESLEQIRIRMFLAPPYYDGFARPTQWGRKPSFRDAEARPNLNAIIFL